MTGTTVPVPTRVLVLGMAHDDGSIRADELYPVAEACGQTPEQVRSCLRRMVTEGRVRREGSGRGAIYVTTELGAAQLVERHQRLLRAYRQDTAGRGWDRRWRLAAFAVPELRRAARDEFRDAVLDLGGAAIQGGLYVCPHPWEDDLRAAAKRLDVADHLTLAHTDELEVAGDRDPRRLARRLWPLDAIAARYEDFITAYGAVPEALEEHRRRRQRLTDAEFLPSTLSMAVAFLGCAAGDPHLPPELLPRPWPGRTARDIVVRSRRLALRLRSDAGRPALFGLFDELFDAGDL